eukprot:g3347.t1
MPRTTKKSSGKKKKARPSFDPEIVTGAKEKKVTVQGCFPNLNVKANETKPRRQSFNLTLNGDEVWDGKSLGPPRAKKFDILLGTALHDAILMAHGK